MIGINGKRKNSITLTFTIISIYFFIISFLIIPSGDDYFWWGKNGHYLLTHNFYSNDPSFGGSSNGRYLGNSLEILIMHSSIFTGVFYSATITMLIFCIWYLTGKSNISLLLSTAIFPLAQFGYIQTIFLWFAGFINYLPPMALLLCYLVLIEKYIKQQYMLSALTYFLIAFAGGLFVEHMTLYQIFVGILSYLLLVILNKNNNNRLSKKISYYYILGSIASAIIMFSNKSYYHNDNEYREIGFSISKILDNYISITHFWIVSLNYLFIIIMCFSIILISFNKIERKRTKYPLILFSILFFIYYSAFNLFIHLTNRITYTHFRIVNLNHNFTIIDALISIVFYIFIILSTIILFKGFKNIDIYFYLFSSTSLLIPFFFIQSPIFIREYFNSFVFMYMISIIYLNTAIKSLRLDIINRLCSNLLKIIVSMLYVTTLFIMVSNYQSNIQRIQDNAFITEYKSLKHKVPYPRYVMLDDSLIMQSPTYWHNKMNFKYNDYFYNGHY